MTVYCDLARVKYDGAYDYEAYLVDHKTDCRAKCDWQ
jgi:hypothetical protein